MTIVCLFFNNVYSTAFRPTTNIHSTLLFNLPERPRAPSGTAASCRLRRDVAEEAGHELKPCLHCTPNPDRICTVAQKYINAFFEIRFRIFEIRF